MGSAGFIPSFGTASQKLTVRLDIYVAADAAGASDSNPGTAAQPLVTIEEAIRRVNAYDEIGTGDAYNIGCVIHVATAAVAYTWLDHFDTQLLRGYVVVWGDGAGQPGDDGFTVLTSGAAVAGSSASQLVMGGGLGVNTYRGRVVQMLTGAAAGDLRTIRDHTDTTIIPCSNFSAAVAAADTWRIVSPSVIIKPDTQIALTDGLGGVSQESIGSGNSTYGAPSFALVNLYLQTTTTASLRLLRSRILLYGTRHDNPGGATAAVYVCDGSSVYMGCDRNVLSPSADLGNKLTAGVLSTTAWRGWGHTTEDGCNWFNGSQFGFQVCGQPLAVRSDVCHFIGGSVLGANANGVFQLATGAKQQVLFGCLTANIAPAFALENTTNNAPVLDVGNTSVGFAGGCDVYFLRAVLKASATGGTSIRARGANNIYVDTSANVTGTGAIGIDARAGAHVDLNGVTGVLGAAGNDLTVDAGATFAAAGSLAAANAALLSAVNGSVIVRVA